MTLLQQLIPIPIPVNDSSGSSASWTHEDTKIAITIWLVTFIWWVVSVIIEMLVNKTKFKDILLVDDYLLAFINTYCSIYVFYCVNLICVFGLLSYGIYNLLW